MLKILTNKIGDRFIDNYLTFRINLLLFLQNICKNEFIRKYNLFTKWIHILIVSITIFNIPIFSLTIKYISNILIKNNNFDAININTFGNNLNI